MEPLIPIDYILRLAGLFGKDAIVDDREQSTLHNCGQPVFLPCPLHPTS